MVKKRKMISKCLLIYKMNFGALNIFQQQLTKFKMWVKSPRTPPPVTHYLLFPLKIISWDSSVRDYPCMPQLCNVYQYWCNVHQYWFICKIWFGFSIHFGQTDRVVPLYPPHPKKSVAKNTMQNKLHLPL